MTLAKVLVSERTGRVPVRQMLLDGTQATCTKGRHRRSGSAARSTSQVTGATSPTGGPVGIP